MHLVTAAAIVLGLAGPAYADQFDAQVQQLQSSISAAQTQQQQLSQQADTLSNKLAALNDQIAAITAQLQLSQVKSDQLNANIAQAEQELQQRKTALAGSVKQLYLASKVTPLEMLASTNSLSDYFDEQQYQDRIGAKIQEEMKGVVALKSDLEKQQAALKIVMDNQAAQKQSLQSAQAEASQLLAQTQGQEANYQSLVAANNQKLQQIYAQRAALDARNHVTISSGGSGGYPYANYTADSGSDPWGFLYRECVSYVAWKRRAAGMQPYPLYWGNAGDWVNYAATSSQPTVGAIAVFPPGVQGAGGVGHVAYVEAVNGNGTINVSEYNWRPYQYDYRSGVAAGGIRFIR